MADHAQEIDQSIGNGEMDVDATSSSGQQRLVLAQGLSEDEATDDEHQWDDLFESRPASPEIRKSPKIKKIPRRLSDPDRTGGNSPEPSPTKKARTSLFGGVGGESMEVDEEPPLTPGLGLGVRFSSLSLGREGSHVDQVQREAEGDVVLDDPFRSSHDGRSPILSPSHHDEDEYESDRYEEADLTSYLDDPVESYGLRKNINRQGAASTHIDIDRSGNYDPAEEARKNALKARAAKQAKQVQQSKKQNSKKPKKKAINERKPKFILKLKFKAMGSVLNVTDNEDNWSDGHSIIDSEDEAERQEILELYRQDSPTPAINQHIADPTGQYDDLTGHTAARGCKECYIKGMTCSMVIDGEYPCQACVDNHRDCDPVTYPSVFGPCKRCVEQGQTCSFENPDGEPQIAMCDECLEADDLDCKPRPPKGYKPVRVDLDRDHYGEGRKYISCTHCREGKKRCSLKKTSDKPPCKRCKRLKIGCHFYAVVARENQKPADRIEKSSDSTEEIPKATSGSSSEFFTAQDLAYMDAESSAYDNEFEDSDEDSDPEILEDAEGHRGFLTTIKTSFAHPMVFCMQNGGDRNAIMGCHFCDLPIFGMVGHFERDVHVIQWSNGLGYTEFGNGHREEKDATIMCRQCINHRLQIMCCPDHIVQPLLLDEEALDHEIAAEALMCLSSGASEIPYELQRWCTMCFSLATYRCCTPQPFVDTDPNDEDQMEMDGCGLRLCDRCAQELEQVYHNKLEDMIIAFDKKPKPKDHQEEEDEVPEADVSDEGTVRADVGLLDVNGLLMKCASASAE